MIDMVDQADVAAAQAQRYVKMAETTAKSAAEKAKDDAIATYIAEADEQAKAKGQEEAMLMQRELSEAGKKAAVNSMKPYENAISTAQERANEYQARGDELSSQSVKLQQESTVLRGEVEQAKKFGLVSQAHQKEGMSQRRMQLAEQKSKESNMFYEYAQNIIDRLSSYSAAASAAAAHARQLIDPNAPKPRPSLV